MCVCVEPLTVVYVCVVPLTAVCVCVCVCIVPLTVVCPLCHMHRGQRQSTEGPAAKLTGASAEQRSLSLAMKSQRIILRRGIRSDSQPWRMPLTYVSPVLKPDRCCV